MLTSHIRLHLFKLTPKTRLNSDEFPTKKLDALDAFLKIQFLTLRQRAERISPRHLFPDGGAQHLNFIGQRCNLANQFVCNTSLHRCNATGFCFQIDTSALCARMLSELELELSHTLEKLSI